MMKARSADLERMTFNKISENTSDLNSNEILIRRVIKRREHVK